MTRLFAVAVIVFAGCGRSGLDPARAHDAAADRSNAPDALPPDAVAPDLEPPPDPPPAVPDPCPEPHVIHDLTYPNAAISDVAWGTGRWWLTDRGGSGIYSMEPGGLGWRRENLDGGSDPAALAGRADSVLASWWGYWPKEPDRGPLRIQTFASPIGPSAPAVDVRGAPALVGDEWGRRGGAHLHAAWDGSRVGLLTGVQSGSMISWRLLVTSEDGQLGVDLDLGTIPRVVKGRVLIPLRAGGFAAVVPSRCGTGACVEVVAVAPDGAVSQRLSRSTSLGGGLAVAELSSGEIVLVYGEPGAVVVAHEQGGEDRIEIDWDGTPSADAEPLPDGGLVVAVFKRLVFLGSHAKEIELPYSPDARLRVALPRMGLFSTGGDILHYVEIACEAP